MIEARRDSILQQQEVEDGGEHSSQLVSTDLKDASRDPIWPCCLPDVESVQSSSDLVLMELYLVVPLW